MRWDITMKFGGATFSDQVCLAVVACAMRVATLSFLLALCHPNGFGDLYGCLSSPPCRCASMREAAALTRTI